MLQQFVDINVRHHASGSFFIFFIFTSRTQSLIIANQ